MSRLIVIPFLCLPLLGQQQSRVPIYRVTVEQRTIRAVNYGHRSGPTKIDFRGTVLLPKAKGNAKVEGRAGTVEVDAKFDNLEAPTRFGRQYLTYVLWAITPDGRPMNLGEILTDADNKGRLRVTAPFQAFGMIVTAEPYFAVTQPSNVVVLENAVRKENGRRVEDVEAKYELLPRAEYPAVEVQPATDGTTKELPLGQYEAVLALYQAQNALQIARAQGAEQPTLEKAEQLYEQAQKLQAEKGSSKRVVMIAREAAQKAEDARTIAARRAAKN